MFLEKLEIRGFKSFAESTELVFSARHDLGRPGITAVVGPNGSGKSNIADAVRWVMGEQSMKLLRGKKSEDVIFSGTDKRARQGMAEVTLHFNNEDGKAPIDYREFSITRRLTRSGESDYLINKNKVRLQDLHLLLAQAHFGQNSYSIIGQGMIDAFLNFSPKERKEFFEEASGVKPLQIKRDQALLKLSRVGENLKTAKVQLDEISPRLRSLTRQVRRLERREEMEGKLRDLQWHFYGESLYLLKKELAQFKGRSEKLATKKKMLEESVKKYQEQMASLTRESSHSDRFSKLQAELQGLQQKRNKIKEQEFALRTEIAQVQQKEARTSVPIVVVRQAVENFQELFKELQSIQARLSSVSNLEDVKGFSARLAETNSKLDQNLLPLVPYTKHESKGEKEDKLKNLNGEIKDIDGVLDEARSKIQELAEHEKKEKTKIWQIQNELQEEQKQLNVASNNLGNMRVEQTRVETKLSDLEIEIREEAGAEFLVRVAEWAPVKKQIDFSDIDKLRSEIHKIKHQLELIGGIDPEVQKEYEEIKTRHDFLSGQMEDLEKSLASLEKIIDDLDENIQAQFVSTFHKVNEEFEKFFKIFFDGGKASLVLIKEEQEEKKEAEEELSLNSEVPFIDEAAEAKPKDEFSKFLDSRKKKTRYSGVEIKATPPGKRLKSISMLSGGERAMTAIALICAIISNNPAPFVLLDEVDAALDEANSLRFAQIIESLSHKAQFIVVTHNRATMEKSDVLYGVTMGEDGVSKLLSLKLEDAAKHVNR